jgi:hypothetical protein
MGGVGAGGGGWFARGTALVAAALAGSCAGIFQHALPARPAACAHLAAGTELRVGAAEREITPPVGGYMSGFSLARTSTGVASPLKVRALVFGLGDRRFAIVGIDNMGLLREDVDWIKSCVAGFANGDVFVCASHTHAGPDLIGLWGWYLLTSGRDTGYLQSVGAATAAAVAEAWARAEPATLVRGEGRIPARGLVKNSNFAECFDRRLAVVHARAVADGRPLGTLLQLSCHPEVLPRRNTLLSADFVGELCDAWRDQGLGQAVFVNGALGAMVSPAVKERNLDGARELGRDLAAIGRTALDAAAPLSVESIEVRRLDVYMPLTTMGLRLGRLTVAIPRELYSGNARTTVGWLRLGALQAVGVPGEMEPALAQRLRARLGVPDLLVFGLCDDELGYLMREQDASDPEFTYERSMSPCLRAGEMVEAALCGARPD